MDPAEIAETRELVGRLHEIMDPRSEEFPIARAFFLLRDDVRALARAFNVDPKTIRRRLCRELKRLRSLLASSRDAR